MKNYFTLTLLVFLFLSSCQDSSIEAIGDPDLSNQDRNSMDFSKYLIIKDKLIHFNSEEAFITVTNHVLKSQNERENFMTFTRQSGHENIYNFYKDFPDEGLEEMAKNKKVPQELTSYFELISEDGGLVLKENLRSTYLRLYFSRELKFYIGSEIVYMKENELFKENNGQKVSLWDKNKGSYTPSKNLRGQGGYAEYSHLGKDYRLKVESDTSWWWTTHNISSYPGVVKTWNNAEFWAHHRRKSWGVWIAQNTEWVKVEGTMSYVTGTDLVIWNIYNQTSNINDAQYAANNVLSYDYTGSCKGVDGNEYSHSISETRGQ